MVPLKIALIECEAEPCGVKSVLECAGHCVLSVSSFYKAKALLFAHSCDVILTDIHLDNGGTAFDFLKWVKSDPLLGQIPFILMDLMPNELAKYLRDGMRIAARELGAAKYISMNQFDAAVFLAEFSEFRPRQNVKGFDRASEAIESNRAKLALVCLKLFEQRDRFVAMLAHDFRTPIAGSQRVIGMMLEGAAGTMSEPQTTLLTALNNTNKALLLMIANVVEIFQREAGDTICLAQIDLTAVVAESTQSMAPVAAGKNIELVTSLQCEELVWADATAMRRVISNLLSNAIKFTPSGGVIEVSLEHSQSEAVLTIRDNGIGMDSEQLTHLFEEFSQEQRSGGASGFGLGLHVCKYLLALQHATIDCVSEPDCGTTFEIALPLSSRNGAALIVEEECEHRFLLEQQLASLSIKTTFVGSGLEAIHAIANNEYVAIFMDTDMPGFDGIRTAEAMRIMGLKVPILACTSTPCRDEQSLLDAGMNVVLGKSTNLELVRSAIDRWVR